jgi:hypothetical protein
MLAYSWCASASRWDGSAMLAASSRTRRQARASGPARAPTPADPRHPRRTARRALPPDPSLDQPCRPTLVMVVAAAPVTPTTGHDETEGYVMSADTRLEELGVSGLSGSGLGEAPRPRDRGDPRSARAPARPEPPPTPDRAARSGRRTAHGIVELAKPITVQSQHSAITHHFRPALAPTMIGPSRQDHENHSSPRPSTSRHRGDRTCLAPAGPVDPVGRPQRRPHLLRGDIE